MKNNQGITLTSLVITIIILIILASVATYSGISTINSAKLTAFETELRIMQSEVNDLYDKYRNEETVLVDSVETNILELGEPIVGTEANSAISAKASTALDGAEVANDETIRERYRYFTKEYIEKLGIEGINQDFLLNIKSRKVVSYQGFSYEGTRYYTLEQLSDTVYNVEYVENENIPTFEASSTQLKNNNWKISIKNIQYEGNIEKWQVKYQKDGWDYWAESDNLEITLTETGYYNIFITNENVSSGEEIVAVGVAEPEPEQSTVATLSQMLYGVIEVEFLNGTSYKTTKTPNTPVLKDEMEAVYWVDENGTIDTGNPANNINPITEDSEDYNKANWYKYVAQTGETDAKTSRWANATTTDGSYYVWIPRYAYRIIYFNNETNEKAYRAGTLTEEQALANGAIVGYSDSRGIVDKDGKRPTSVTSTTEISVNDKYFRTHPVFDGNPDKGGWDSQLEGIWVMKYEASRDDADETIPKSVPNVKSWVSTNLSTMFTYARDAYNDGDTLNTILNSHVMKNSEWGAVAYLAESKYGRNGTEISVNQCSSKITGAGRGTGDNPIYNSTYSVNTTTNLPETEQQYNGNIGQLSSTTGNIYGIYDMAGGSWEYVMGFYQDENGNIRTGTTAKNSGFNGYLDVQNQKEDGIEFPTEKKYYQLYQKTTSDGDDLGGALYETQKWDNDSFRFVDPDTNPIFIRGGMYNNEGYGGVFYVNAKEGFANGNVSFRVCLTVQ